MVGFGSCKPDDALVFLSLSRCNPVAPRCSETKRKKSN